MVTVTEGMIKEIGRAIVEAAHPERIILFGSRARGEGGAHSDIDLIVVESEPFSAARSRRRELARIGMKLRDWRVPLDLLLYSRDEMERWRGDRNHVLGRALREGKILYERE